MKTLKAFLVITAVCIGLASFGTLGVAYAQTNQPAAKAPATGSDAHGAKSNEGFIKALDSKSHAVFYAIAITIGVACLSSGYAVAKVGSAALGAAAEKPELLGKALIFVGLAEGIAIYGLIIAIMLVMKL